MTQGIQVRDSIDKSFEATFRRRDECLLRSDPVNIQNFGPCRNLTRSPFSSTGHALWEMMIWKN